MPFGPSEIAIVGVLALLLFGPKKLPELAKGLGRGLRSFKKELEGKSEDESQKLSAGAQTPEAIDVSSAPSSTVPKTKAGTNPEPEPNPS